MFAAWCYAPGKARMNAIVITCLPLVVVVNCSVFPEKAILPAHVEGGTDGGGQTSTHGGVSGAGEDVTPPAGEGGVGANAGQASVGLGGAGGQAGTGQQPACVDLRTARIPVDADTWIEPAKPNARHGGDELLSLSGDSERRALFGVKLPAGPAGAVLTCATFLLYRAGAAGTDERQLALHRLTRAFDEQRASWRSHANGSRWNAPGGDFGPVLATAAVSPEPASGEVAFDVTDSVGRVAGQTVDFYWLVQETTNSPTSLTELAFSSREGLPATRPELVVDYCVP